MFVSWEKRLSSAKNTNIFFLPQLCLEVWHNAQAIPFCPVFLTDTLGQHKNAAFLSGHHRMHFMFSLHLI